MADWSQLPKELLELIAQRLYNHFDSVRFRSICSYWRSSVPAKHPLFPNRFPILPNDGLSYSTWGFYLSKHTIYRLSPALDSTAPCNDGWLIKVEQDHPERAHLLNPLSRTAIKRLPSSFPKTLDLSRFRISELGQEYVLQYINYKTFADYLVDDANLYMEKVAFCVSPNCFDYALLTIHVSGKLAMFKSGDKKWTIVEDSPYPYDDVIVFDGHFYAVDGTGKTVAVDPFDSVTLVAPPVFGGDKKCLVESMGELLLVDVYLSFDPDDTGDYGLGEEEDDENGACYMSEKTVRFKVFRLDQAGKNWIEVQSLADRILFLGDNCSFSASVSDFSGCKGNCIYFTDAYHNLPTEMEGAFWDHEIGVFDLDSGIIGPLTSSKLFWPPPSWVTSTASGVENQIEELSL